MTESKLDRLRALDGEQASEINDTYYEIEELLYDLGAKEVHKEFEEGGRWYNYETRVHSVETAARERFFSIHQQVPASETQEGMDLSWEFNEVDKREKTIIVYE